MPRRHDRSSTLLAPASDAADLVLTGPLAPYDALREDTLSDVLRAVRLTSALFFITDAGPLWLAQVPSARTLARVVHPGSHHLISFHVLRRGSCWCEMPGQPPTRLEAGDILAIPHGDPYTLASSPGLPTYHEDAALKWFRQMAAGELPFVVVEGGAGGERIHVLCGFLACDIQPFNPLLTGLPRMLVMHPLDGSESDRLRQLVEVAMAEAHERRAGRDCVLLRLAELMFIEVVRQHLAQLPAEHTGWLAGLHDAIVGRALDLLHRRPANDWTVESLARAAGLSRSALSERFTHFVGHPPMQYLTRWRMQLAATLLSDGATKVSAVGLEVGYDSEAAFSRAFKKVTGVSPSVWRAGGSNRQPRFFRDR
ncbi:MAG: AraC family transcriptional regulator [Candidatus Methylomirabilaceae bacterium]